MEIEEGASMLDWHCLADILKIFIDARLGTRDFLLFQLN
jgi:hypothetical protein